MIPDTPSQELYEKLKAMLRETSVLSDLSEAQIARFASQAQYEEFKQGTVFIEQGAPADSFYFIMEGQVRVIDVSAKPPRLLNYMHEGEFVGELAFIRREPRAATVDVVVDALLARFDRRAWDDLLSYSPEVKDRFQQAEAQYTSYARLHFEGQQTDEVTILKERRHILVAIVNMAAPLFTLLIGLLLGWLLNDLKLFNPAINYGCFTGFFVLLALMMGGYFWLEWWNDDFIVSTKRVIHIERDIFGGTHREEAPLTQIHDVVVSTPNFFTRTFGYTDVIIKSAGLGSILFDGVRDGERIKRIIFAQREKAKERVQATDLAAIRKSLAGRIGWAGGPLEAKPLPVVDTTPPKSTRPLPRLLRYYIPRVREETPDGVIWHKHYLIWLKNIALPTLVGWISLYVFIASLAGLPPFVKGPNYTATAWLGVWLVINFVWYTYMHDDWAKDLYIVTNTKIVRQDSSAFRLRGEEIRETTFDNVQNINYESPNFLARLLQLGRVVIETATVGEKFVFDDVFAPIDVQQEIFSRWVAFKERQRQRQRESEEERFTTWLGEYHKMMNETKEMPPS